MVQEYRPLRYRVKASGHKRIDAILTASDPHEKYHGRSPAMTISQHWQASDGTSLHYCLDDFTDPWKKAECLVLLHPGLGSAQRLFAWVPHLAREYRVARPDLRGHGQSQPGMNQPLTQERLARDLTELLDHLQCDKAHVAGASAGGMIAMQAALRFPERFASLALFAATARIAPERPQKGDWLGRGARGRRGPV